MEKRLADFSTSSLERANRANLYEFFRHFENSPFMEFSRKNGILRWSCPFQYAWFNAILCTRDPTPADSEYIDESLAYFKAKNTYEISCWLEDGVDLDGWKSLLAPRNFRWVQGPPGMSVDLNQLQEANKLPAGVEIKIVQDEQSTLDCAEVLIKGYGFPPDWKGTAYDFMKGLGLDGPYRSYMAYWQGKPVSTAGGFFGREVVGVYSVATLPEARGKGIGAAITLAPLIDARKLGYRIGTLQASEMGFPVYKKMGFEQNFFASSFFRTF